MASVELELTWHQLNLTVYTRTCCCYCFTVTDVFQGKRVDSLIQGGIRTNVASVEFDTRLNMLLLFCHSHRHSPVPLFVFCYKVVGRQCSAVVIVRHSRRLSHYCQCSFPRLHCVCSVSS